jgi:hypothetical protein
MRERERGSPLLPQGNPRDERAEGSLTRMWKYIFGEGELNESDVVDCADRVWLAEG